MFSIEFEYMMKDRIDYYLSANPYWKLITLCCLVVFVVVLWPIPNNFEWIIFIGPIVGAAVTFFLGHLSFLLCGVVSLLQCSRQQRKINLILSKDEVRLTDGTGTSTTFPRSQITSFTAFKRGKLIKFGAVTPIWLPARAFDSDVFDQEVFSQLGKGK